MKKDKNKNFIRINQSRKCCCVEDEAEIIRFYVNYTRVDVASDVVEVGPGVNTGRKENVVKGSQGWGRMTKRHFLLKILEYFEVEKLKKITQKQ